MKKIISFAIIGLMFGCTFAYTPTTQDVTQINLIKAQLDTASSGNVQTKWDFYIQLKTLKEQYASNEQLSYYLDMLSAYTITQVNNQKTVVKATSKQFKQNFSDQYSGGFSVEITGIDSCTWRYNTIDSISFANNFPTALTMATRYRETTCGYYLPNNGDGPFQILSKDYGTGTITEAKFLQSVQDFIDFSKAKYVQYTNRLWISLTYTGFNMTGLVNHAALYNWATITGSTESGYVALPINPNYVYDGYGAAYSGATRYGIVPKFLKVLDRELKNSY